jgi:hypothetical protein
MKKSAGYHLDCRDFLSWTESDSRDWTVDFQPCDLKGLVNLMFVYGSDIGPDICTLADRYNPFGCRLLIG